ncbi:hypothetical protein RCL_jg26310.t1 [Rhizophagus clarus]|uniref:Uncharacterized protein n=1 Tax=Rhizophagus clarus TaxID=94130 RepID=A0A8H3KUZ9_9GLOM|nr:hypothetical protein RCL_jg26310.t1 [Rhizophagus clarus]
MFCLTFKNFVTKRCLNVLETGKKISKKLWKIHSKVRKEACQTYNSYNQTLSPPRIALLGVHHSALFTKNWPNILEPGSPLSSLAAMDDIIIAKENFVWEEQSDRKR